MKASDALLGLRRVAAKPEEPWRVLVPLLLVVVHVPLRVTIGSSLGITAVGALAGFVGKVITGQVPLVPALAVAAGAIPGAQVGAAVSRRLSGRQLKFLLFTVIALTAIRVWFDLIERWITPVSAP